MKYVLVLFTIPCLSVVAYFQGMNWRDKPDGNGADKVRVGMMIGSVAAIGSCACCALYLFFIPVTTPGYHFVEIAGGLITLVPFVGGILYWPMFKAAIVLVVDKLKRIIKS